MSIRRKPADDDIDIDCFRGKGAHCLTPEPVLKVNKDRFKDMLKPDMVMMGKLAIAIDFNKTVEPSQNISYANIALAKRCSAAIKIAARAYDHKINKNEPGLEPKVLVIKPAYALLKESFTDLGWGVVETESFVTRKTNMQRLAAIRKALQADKKGEIRALSINTPNNPLCEVYNEAFTKGLLQILKEYPRVTIFSDVVYEKLVDAERPVPTVFRMADENLRQRIYEFSGNSKTVMPGDKRTSGWMFSSQENIEMVERLLEKGKISNGKTHCLSKKRIATLLASLSVPESYYQNLFAYYAGVKEQLSALINPQLPTGVKLFRNNHLHFMMFDFSELRNLGINITPADVTEYMQDEHRIRLLPSIRIGSEDYLRISLGSLFLRKDKDYDFEYKPDGRDEDFAPEYKDWIITSDVSVHKYIAGIICKTINCLIEEKLTAEKVAPSANERFASF